MRSLILHRGRGDFRCLSHSASRRRTDVLLILICLSVITVQIRIAKPGQHSRQSDTVRRGHFAVRCCTEAGPVAQRLEQRTHNPLVPGSNPGGPTNIPKDLGQSSESSIFSIVGTFVGTQIHLGLDCLFHRVGDGRWGFRQDRITRFHPRESGTVWPHPGNVANELNCELQEEVTASIGDVYRGGGLDQFAEAVS